MLSDPQSLNGYAYSRNNPITLVDPDGKDWNTFGQGLASPFVYAYQHPLETVATVVVVAAAAAVAPVAVAVLATAAGSVAIGTALGNASVAPDANTRDYYLGAAVTNTALTAAAIKSGASLSSTKPALAESGIADDALVCRGGACTADRFLKGSNEYKAGLNPTLDSKVTGVSVNVGNDINSLLKAGNLPRYSQYGKTTSRAISQAGGTVDMYPGNTWNPYHGHIDGLTPNQLERLFGQSSVNPYKLK
jgi:hypothetical protein